MIRLASVSVIPAIRRGQRGFLLRWREHGPADPREIWGKCYCWFVDRDEAIHVRDAMRQGETFEMALALMKARIAAA